jgi:hypothetical protein
MTPVSTSLASQRHAPVLTANPGASTLYRVAFAGGVTFEPVADCGSAEEAARMLIAASNAVARLREIAREATHG